MQLGAVFLPIEVRSGRKETFPGAVLHHNGVGDLKASMELRCNDCLVRCYHIDSGVLLWVCRGYDRHFLELVLEICTGIPYWKIKSIWLRLFQHHWQRPIPTGKHSKKFMHQRGTGGVGIKLASSSHQNGPRYPSKESQSVGVDAAHYKRTQQGEKISTCIESV